MSRPSIAELVSSANKSVSQIEITCEECGKKEKRSSNTIKRICLECINKRDREYALLRSRKKTKEKQKTKTNRKTLTTEEKKERETSRFYKNLKKANTAIWLSRVEVFGQGRTEKVPSNKLKASDFKFKQGKFNEQ